MGRELRYSSLEIGKGVEQDCTNGNRKRDVMEKELVSDGEYVNTGFG